VDANELIAGNGEQAPWVVLTQVRLARERQMAEVGERADIIRRRDAGRAQPLGEWGNAGERAPDGRPQPFQLQRRHPLARQSLRFTVPHHGAPRFELK
jgi:hypothetical protein